MTNDDLTPAPAPPGIGAPGRALWDAIAAEVAGDGFELDARERRILADAARTADDLARLEEAADGAPVMVTGSMGQPVPNRIFDEARKCRALIATLLRQVGTRPAAETARPAVTPGSRSSAARAAASIRWGKGATGAGGA